MHHHAGEGFTLDQVLGEGKYHPDQDAYASQCLSATYSGESLDALLPYIYWSGASLEDTQVSLIPTIPKPKPKTPPHLKAIHYINAIFKKFDIIDLSEVTIAEVQIKDSQLLNVSQRIDSTVN